MSTPEIIRDQLGREALLLMGATNLCGVNETLSLKIRGCPKINQIKITLEPTDTYMIEFFKGAKRISSYSGIYVDQLHDTIEGETGLFLSFRRRQHA